MAHDVWLDLLDPDPAAIASIPEEVHPSALERIMEPVDDDNPPRPRIDSHGGHFFGILVVATVDEPGSDVKFHEIDFIISPEHLITIRKTPPGAAPIELRELCEAAAASKVSPGMALYFVFDDVAERFLALIDELDAEVDELEDRVEEWDATRIRNNIGRLRHDILDNRLEIDDGEELFPRDVEIRFADAYDKLLRATDGLDLARDLLAGVRDYHQAKVSNDQNEVMKRLTVVASLLLVPTLIVGVYGQNFDHMPELHWRLGYAFSWSVILISTILQIIFFRRRNWI
jgi:magnesium transporter